MLATISLTESWGINMKREGGDDVKMISKDEHGRDILNGGITFIVGGGGSGALRDALVNELNRTYGALGVSDVVKKEQ